MGNADRVLAGALNIPGGEFASGFSGSCGQYITAAMLHLYDQARWPMTAGTVANLVTEGLAHGWADPALHGGETMANLVNQLEYHGVSVTWLAYQEPLQADWRGALAQYAGLYPVGLELARGGALIGDEAALRYHFVLVVGLLADGRYVLVDGDRTDGTSLYAHGLDELAAAVPCAYVRGLALPPGGQAMWTLQADGSARDSVGHVAGTGLAHPLVDAHAPDGKRSESPYNGAGDVFINLVDGQVYTWSHAEGVRTDRGGLVIDALAGQNSQLLAQLAALKTLNAADAALGQAFRAAVKQAQG